jgi:hypothetical protein
MGLRDCLGNQVWERDDLVHAIEEWEYNELWRKTDKPLSICVDVVEDQQAFIGDETQPKLSVL